MTTEVRPPRSTIALRAAALIRVLRRRARDGGAPMSAAELAPLIGVPACQGHETKRRRVREAASAARFLLREAGAEHALIADGEGYRLAADRSAIVTYLRRRRHFGLRHLSESHHEEHSAAMAAASGQGVLFAPDSLSALEAGL